MPQQEILDTFLNHSSSHWRTVSPEHYWARGYHASQTQYCGPATKTQWWFENFDREREEHFVQHATSDWCFVARSGPLCVLCLTSTWLDHLKQTALSDQEARISRDHVSFWRQSFEFSSLLVDICFVHGKLCSQTEIIFATNLTQVRCGHYNL